MSATTVPPGVMAAIDELAAGVQSLGRVMPDLIATINGALRWVPPLVPVPIDLINSLLEELGRFLQTCLDKLLEVLQGAAFVWYGHEIAGRWDDTVRDPVGSAAQTVSGFRLTNSWEGEAAEAYAGRVLPDQQTAMTETADLAQEIGAVLRGLANAVGAFYAALLAAWVTYQIAIAAGAGQAATVVLIPGGILTVSGATAAFIAFLVASLGALQVFVSGQANSLSALVGSLNSTAFPNRAWPIP